MRNYLIVFFIIALLASCESDKDGLAFIIPENNAEVVNITLTTKQAGASFYYLIQAENLIINWDDGSKLTEYKYGDLNNNWVNLKPIQHTYADANDYNLNIRCFKPNVLDLSNTDSLSRYVEIKALTLTNCMSLKGLYLRKQMLTELDLTNAENLEVLNIENSNISTFTTNKTLTKLTSLLIDSTNITDFDCNLTPQVMSLSIGSKSGLQNIQNTDSLYNLRSLAIRGNVKQTAFSATKNDSLQLFKASYANITQINLNNLQLLISIDINACKQLTSITLSNNKALQSITLTNNSALTAVSLNNFFKALPTTISNNSTITLKGNVGDATCDKTIATNKGWTFK